MKLNIKQLPQQIGRLLRDKDERNLLINIAMAFAVKGLALFVSMFSMPLYMRYFNNQDVLGVWYTILSLLNWVLICDLGLGNGLRNRLTEALAVNDIKRSKSYVSSTYVAITAIILPIAVIGFAAFQFLDLNSFFNIDPAIISPATMRTAVSILWFGVCLHMITKTINVVIYAIQKSSMNNVIALIVSVLPLVYIFLFKGSDTNMEQNLIILTVVHVIASNLPLIITSLILFRTRTLRGCSPSLKAFDGKTAKGMLNFGIQFFGAQIFFMFLTSTNEIIITQIFSSADVVDYSIYYRLFTVVGSLFMLALTPLWSKVTKDLAQKKYEKIRKTNYVLYAISGLAVLGEFIMVLLCQFVVNIWLGDEAITVSYPTALIFAFYGSVYIFNVVLTTVANGIGDLRTQIWFYGFGALLKIPAIYVMALRVDSWNIVMLYNAVVLLIFCIFQLIWVEKMLKKLTKDKSESSLDVVQVTSPVMEPNNVSINEGEQQQT